jgi:hypothetical protein
MQSELSKYTTTVCRKMGLESLPVAFGVETAKWITVGTIDVTQAAVAAYLFAGLHEPLYGAILTALILPQVKPCSLSFFSAPQPHFPLFLQIGCPFQEVSLCWVGNVRPKG